MKTFAIAVFTKNRTNPAYEGARLGADRTAARLGARTCHYVPERADDIDQQIALVDRAIADAPDAAVFVPVHQTAIDAAILKLEASGVPIVSLIAPIAVGRPVTFVGADDRALARAITHEVARRLDGRGRVLILEGIPASGTTRARHAGILDALGDHPDIAVAASLRGDYQRDVARAAVAQALARGLAFDAVIAANDSMALGALDALEASRARDAARVIAGVNALPEAIDAIRRGRMHATADFDAMKMAAVATEAAIRHLRGEAVPPRIELPVQVIDALNCALWDRPYAERALPSWFDVTGTA
jgi:ribose transport system substrate-binding protein